MTSSKNYHPENYLCVLWLDRLAVLIQDRVLVNDLSTIKHLVSIIKNILDLEKEYINYKTLVCLFLDLQTDVDGYFLMSNILKEAIKKEHFPIIFSARDIKDYLYTYLPTVNVEITPFLMNYRFNKHTMLSRYISLLITYLSKNNYIESISDKKHFKQWRFVNR